MQNLSITQQGNNTGLFGYASGATMQNICIDGNVTLSTTKYTEGYGSIAGRIDNSTISNCHSSVNFTIETEMDASKECIGHIGGIVGKMNETTSTESYVSGCSYSGTINLGNNNVKVVAGIVGYAIYSDVPITNCSFTGTIKSECNDAIIIGGIFGYTNSGGEVKVTNCLQAGTLEKPGNTSLTGILIGQINGGYGANAVTNNYYTSSTFKVIGSTSGTPTTTPATQCSTKQLQSGEICYLLNGSSSNGGWGQKLGTDSYPVPGSNKKVYYGYVDCKNMTYSNNPEELSENPVHHYDNGFGTCTVCGDKLYVYQPATLTTDKYDIDGDDTKDEVYEIGNAGQLYWFAGLVNGTLEGVTRNKSANAVLIANITVNKDVLNANGQPNGSEDDFREWTPIGQSSSKAYSGTFDGQGHTISGLWHWWSADYIGLFGNNEGTIKNLGVVDSYLRGHDNVGGVCGWNSGSLTNCYYLANEDDKNGGKSEIQFASGEVAYLLNGSSSDGEWGQQIGTDKYPVLGSYYKVLKAAQDGQNGTNYWATFSNLNSNAELMASTGNVTVYNATVSGGTLTLTKRSDNRVAMEEGVLLKANCEYLNAKNISDEVSAAKTGENDLVATPKDAGVINAGTGYTLYRLTYNKTATKEGLGFYLGVVGDIKDGSKLKATPGKAYLKVLTSEAKLQSSTAKPARGFAFPGDDDETTGIECITVTDESLYRNGNAEGIFDLQGRKVSKPTKGVYINNGKKVIIK